MEKLKKLFFGKYFFILNPLLILFIIHLFSQPYYLDLSDRTIPCDRCCNLQKKIARKDHLLESVSNLYEPSTHMSKTEFRLTVPFLIKILGVQTKIQAYILQVIFGFLFFMVLTLSLLKNTEDKFLTFLFCLGFAFLYPGYLFVAESEGYFDSFAFLFLIIGFLDINFFWIHLSLFLAFWTDERALFSGLLIVLWRQYQNQTENKGRFAITKVAYSYFLAGSLYFLLRFYLIHYRGFKNQLGDVGWNILKHTLDYSGLYFWQIFEGFWILVILGFYYLWKNKEEVIFYFLGIIAGAIVLANLFVLDLTRAGSYLFPLTVISFLIVYKQIKDRKSLINLLLFIIAIGVINPRFTLIAPEYPQPNKPIYRIYYSIYMKILKKWIIK